MIFFRGVELSKFEKVFFNKFYQVVGSPERGSLGLWANYIESATCSCEKIWRVPLLSCLKKDFDDQDFQNLRSLEKLFEIIIP